jgi:uncharacterized protein YfaP (DUF2135 family)
MLPCRIAILAAAALFAVGCSDSTGGSPPDTTAPTVRIDAPQNNALTAAGTATVTGVASDDAGVSRLSYRLNGGVETAVVITAGASVTFSFPVTLASGSNTVQVLAYDAAGNTSSASVGTVLDNTPPAATVTTPTVNAAVIAPSVTVQGTATDARGVTRITYQVNGGAETNVTSPSGPSVTFNFPVALALGANAITLNAYDEAGNRSQVQRSVERQIAGVALVSVRGVDGAPVSDAVITATAGGPAGAALRLPGGPSREVVFAPGGGFAIENLGNGDYRVYLPVGPAHVLSISHPSFLALAYNNVAVQQENTTQLEPVRMVPSTASSPGSANIHVSDAFNGQSLAGVTLGARLGINATTGTPLAVQTTGAQGTASFVGLAAGSYTVEMTRAGYSAGYFTMTIVGGQTGSYPSSIAPTVAAGQIRIILDWGISPSDLDSHLTGPTVDGSGRFHVFYADDVYFEGSTVAALDHDDVTSYGPETITIYTQSTGTYRYSVHDYTNRDLTSGTALGASGARVRVYLGGTLVRTFHVPTGVGGTLWKVFELNGTTITPLNQMSYHENPGTVAVRGPGSSQAPAKKNR